MNISVREIIALLCLLAGLGLIFFTESKPLTWLAFALILIGGAVIASGKRKS